MAENKLFKLNNVRIVFPKLFDGEQEKYQETDKDAYYGASWLIVPTDPQVEAIKAEIRRVAVAKWKDQAEAMLKAFALKDKLPLHDGDLKATKPYGAAYKGMLYISARNNARTNPPIPVYDNVIDPATGKARVITSRNDPHAPYSGCFTNVYLNFFGYTTGGEGIACSIAGVQFSKDGERLSGGVQAAADDFEAVKLEDVFPEESKQATPTPTAKSLF